jgi:hypothetical protein
MRTIWTGGAVSIMLAALIAIPGWTAPKTAEVLAAPQLTTSATSTAPSSQGPPWG